MVIDGGLGSAEHNLPDEIVSQKIVREAQFDLRGFVQLGDLFAGQLPVEAFQVILNLRGAASADNWDDQGLALAQPVKRHLRGGTANFVRQRRHRFSDAELPFIRRVGFAPIASGVRLRRCCLAIFAAENATSQRAPCGDPKVEGARHRQQVAFRLTLCEAVFYL